MQGIFRVSMQGAYFTICMYTQSLLLLGKLMLEINKKCSQFKPSEEKNNKKLAKLVKKKTHPMDENISVLLYS